MSEQKENDFYALETQDVEIERNGVTLTFRVRELRGNEATRVLDILKPNGKRDVQKLKTLDARLIAASAVQIMEDGTERKITKEDADQFGTKLRRAITTVALSLNGIGDDADEKND